MKIEKKTYDEFFDIGFDKGTILYQPKNEVFLFYIELQLKKGLLRLVYDKEHAISSIVFHDYIGVSTVECIYGQTFYVVEDIDED